MTARTGSILLIAVLALADPASAQRADSTLLTIRRIYGGTEFVGESFGPARWLDGGSAYTTVEPGASGRGEDIVRYSTAQGRREVLVSATQLTPMGDTLPLTVEDYVWSPDGQRLLVFTNSRPVWRQNNRGDYWLLDRASGELRQLGGPDAKPSTLLFAKFSPDGGRVGYVRENNLYVEDLASGRITALTRDGSRTIINGTFDWIYEEELDLRDGWRWSPDGRTIAYWQLDASGVRDFYLIDNTDSVYSQVIPVQYPKAGETNSAARVGAVDAAGGPTRWFDVPGDPRNHYVARMEWAPRPGAAAGPNADPLDEVLIQRLNRLQNTNEVLLGDARTGQVRPVLTERDSAWVEVVDDVVWLDGGKRFTWVSERDGWRHVYVVSRDGRTTRLVTPGAFDVISVQGVDPTGGWLYYIASPHNPAQRYLFRIALSGAGRPERLSPTGRAGTHSYDISPDFRWALHQYSNFTTPPTTSLIQLPEHATVRTLVDNADLRARVAALQRGSAEFFYVQNGRGAKLQGWMMKPADFDSTTKYPLLFYVYGGPARQTVLDAWDPGRYLWHLLLTQHGYLVASVDNRGSPSPRGRAWRKIIYGQLNLVESNEQAQAARAISQRAYVDSARIGIWGWSNGATISLMDLFRFPRIYRAAIAVAPVTNWRFYDTIYTERYNGLPQANPQGYDRASPLSYADSLQGNLLLIHGTGDDNVHVQNTEALVNALVAANKSFSLMEYPNRNHSLAGGNTRVHLFELMTRYLADNLRGQPDKRLVF